MAKIFRLPYELEMKLRRQKRKQFVKINLYGLKFRIRETDTGWICEKGEKVFFKTVWKPYVTYNGLNECYPFLTDERALNGMLEEINDKIIRQFRWNT